uniref:Uncharacterized protein n=1 Tax=Anopheles atroparvus TaxID=41427 RepID=A0A182IT85_ANOAO
MKCKERLVGEKLVAYSGHSYTLDISCGWSANRWITSLCVLSLALVLVLESGADAYRMYPMMARHKFGPMMMRRPAIPMRFTGFVRSENPNADGAMDAQPNTDGKEGEMLAPPSSGGSDAFAPAALHAEARAGHEGTFESGPMMREMVHHSEFPVEIDMGTDMQARVMGFMDDAEADDGNFGRAAGEGEEEQEGEGGAQFRHKKHKKHKHVVHTHHHYHHKKEGYGHGHGGYGHKHGYGHGYGDDEKDGDEYEPTYGHHGRYRRSGSSESADTDAQALDRTDAQPSQTQHTSLGQQQQQQQQLLEVSDVPLPAEVPVPEVTETGYRQSISRRQLVRSKNERLAQIGRERAFRAHRYDEEGEAPHGSDGPCPAEYVEIAGEGLETEKQTVGTAQDSQVVTASKRRPFQPLASMIGKLFKRPSKSAAPSPVVARPENSETKALQREIQSSVATKSPSGTGANFDADLQRHLSTKGQLVGASLNSSAQATPSIVDQPSPGTFFPELGSIVSVRFIDGAGRERTVPFELTSRQLGKGNGSFPEGIPLNYNFFYFHCIPTPSPPNAGVDDDRMRSMAKRMIDGLEGRRAGWAKGGEEANGGGSESDTGEPQHRWQHRRRMANSEWRRRRQPSATPEKVVERRTAAGGEMPTEPAFTTTTVSSTVPANVEDADCDQICSSFYIDERKLTSTSTTMRPPGQDLEELVEEREEPEVQEDGPDNRIDSESIEDPLEAMIARQESKAKEIDRPTSTRNPLWRGLSKRLNMFRERHVKSPRRKPSYPRMTTALPPATMAPPELATIRLTGDELDHGYDSNEIVEYYNDADVGRVLYRMANGRLFEEPQRIHFRRSPNGEDTWRRRRLDRLAARMGRMRKTPTVGASEPKPVTDTLVAATESSKPVVNIGTFRVADPNNAARPQGTPSDMDNYIAQKVREYCQKSCPASSPADQHGYVQSLHVIPPSDEVVGSSIIVQPAHTQTDSATPPKSPPVAATATAGAAPCKAKIVKCIPRALAEQQGQRKPSRTSKANGEPSDTSDDPLVSFARRMRQPPPAPIRNLMQKMLRPFGPRDSRSDPKVVRTGRQLIFDPHNPRMAKPYGGRPTSTDPVERRNQLKELRREMANRPRTRPFEAIKNAISSIRYRMAPTTTTPAPTTTVRRMGRSRRTKPSRARTVATRDTVAAAAPPPPPPPPPPAPAASAAPVPINCAECRRACGGLWRPQSRASGGRRVPRPLASRRNQDGAMVASAGPVEQTSNGEIVASTGNAEPGNWFLSLFDPQEEIVSNAMETGGMMQDIVGSFLKAWTGSDETVAAPRSNTYGNLPYCEDIE